MTASYLVVGFAVCVALALHHPDSLPARAWAVLLERPAALAMIGAAVLVVCWRRQRDLAWWALGAAAAIAAVAFGEATRVVSESRAHLVPLLAIVPTAALLAGYRVRRGVLASFAIAWAAGLGMLIIALLLAPDRHAPVYNRLGLVSGQPLVTFTQDYSSHPQKDDYPPVTISNNSLGYRDIEPPPAQAGRKRVLLVGDSYVWGDGIPEARDTLPALVRAKLETLSPGQFDVMAAAYPGLGCYGYRRAVQAMTPEVHPDIVVVGYLGDADLDPLDTQALRDLLPSQRWLARVTVNLRTLQDFHEAAMAALQDPAWRVAYGARRRDELFRALAEFAREPGHRALLVCYYGACPVVEGIDGMTVPAAWRYQGHRSELWYAKDSHPKPALSRLLGDWLASELARPGSSTRHTSEIEQPAAGGPVIPPGQEQMILDMLGGQADIGGCRLKTASVKRDVIEAAYGCGSGDARMLTLRYPQGAAGGSETTAKFAITGGADADRELAAAVADRVRAHESAFQWVKPEAGRDPVPAAPKARLPWHVMLACGVALALVAAGWRSPPQGAKEQSVR